MNPDKTNNDRPNESAPAAGAATATPAAAPAPARPSKRRTALLSIAAVTLVVGAAVAGWEYFVGSRQESTDNAYVQGNLVQITPQVGGTVIAILADDTDFVQAGQPLLRLDPADARVALEQAEAALGQAVRQVRTLYVNNGSLAAQVTLRQADVSRAQGEVQRATEDLRRREGLVPGGAVSREELQHAQAQLNTARSALAAAEAAVAAAREQLASNRAMTEGTSVEQHPSVQAAAARVKEAWLAQQRLTIVAPVDGHVARRTVQLGQRIPAGAPLMAIVPLQQLWVDANFKEVQLRKIRIGQPVTLGADLYGGKVRYHGTVAGLSAGTGAAFALLPAQNATGNWIKVVQRVPVRIALDPQELARNPLRVGLSMEAQVDVSHQDGKMLSDLPANRGTMQTQVLATQDGQADQQVRRVIARNMAQPLPPRSETAGLPAAHAQPAAAPAARTASAERNRTAH